MPSSQYYQIPKIIEMLISINPYSVLDIGSGFGNLEFYVENIWIYEMEDKNTSSKEELIV
ncbi:MAG: hypothetical protein AB7V56_06900 [Candidatus Nitrosocosmicus sp.]